VSGATGLKCLRIGSSDLLLWSLNTVMKINSLRYVEFLDQLSDCLFLKDSSIASAS